MIAEIKSSIFTMHSDTRGVHSSTHTQHPPHTSQIHVYRPSRGSLHPSPTNPNRDSHGRKQHNSESTLLWKLNLQEGELGRGRELLMSSGPSSAQLLFLCQNRHYTSEISWSWLGRGRVFPAARKQTLQAAPFLCMCACIAAHNPVHPLTCTCTPTNSEKQGRECMIFLILKGKCDAIISEINASEGEVI